MTDHLPTVEEIRAAVNRREPDLVALLRRLVRIPSVTGNEGPVQIVVAEAMTAIGLNVDVWEPSAVELAPYAEHVGAFDTLAGRPNVIGSWHGTSGGRSIILNGHIDTVEPGDPGTWTHPANDAVIDGRTVIGRGSLDMKGGVVTNLMAVAALRDLGFAPRGTIHVESVISEEDGGAGALATILRGYRADAAIITEPTERQVVVAQGGSLVFRIRLQGKSAHGAIRNEGVSALECFRPIWLALNAFETRRNAEIDHPLYEGFANKIPINIGIVQAGSWPSSVPEWLVAEGRAGLVPGEDLVAFKQQFTNVVLDAAASDPWLRDHPPAVEWFSGQFAPAETAVDHPIVATLGDAHLAVTGMNPVIAGVTYGADMRHFILFGDTPCIMYGAGDVRMAHHANEAIAIDDLLEATTVIALAVATWTS